MFSKFETPPLKKQNNAATLPRWTQPKHDITKNATTQTIFITDKTKPSPNLCHFQEKTKSLKCHLQ